MYLVIDKSCRKKITEEAIDILKTNELMWNKYDYKK